MTTRFASPTSAGSPAAGSSPTLRAYGRCVDGLFTYCLSVLCDHDAALAAVAEVRDLALRHGGRLADPGLGRAWLYALARHCCLEQLERGSGSPAEPPGTELADRRRRELASLAWPEAAGTEPEQREALELAVRHRLSPEEVAAVLGRSGPAVADLLATAGAEVGRTRTALLVLGVGSCPVLARLGGVGAESWRGWVLGPALRRELVQHVVDCPTCRGTAERVAGELGTGLAGLPGLPLLTAPVPVRLGGTAAQLPDGAAGAAFLAGAAAGRRATAPVRGGARQGAGAGARTGGRGGG
ncbi:RNA polymerase sigma factor, partial [Kitasatospora sp. MBT63]|uniref:RNA polymerase sigma factor n=1 Tax=Kitasatospora sp. MBT63 TaxID=1444768 RepID=UPI0034D00FF0